MKRTLTFRIIAIICISIGLMLAACACDASENAETEGKTDATVVTEAPTTAVTEAESATEPETEPESNAYTIKVVDENGNALEGVFAQICSGDLCLAPYFTDANGIVSLEQDLSDYTVKAYLDGYTAEKTEYEFENDSKVIEIVMTKN